MIACLIPAFLNVSAITLQSTSSRTLPGAHLSWHYRIPNSQPSTAAKHRLLNSHTKSLLSLENSVGPVISRLAWQQRWYVITAEASAMHLHSETCRIDPASEMVVLSCTTRHQSPMRHPAPKHHDNKHRGVMYGVTGTRETSSRSRETTPSRSWPKGRIVMLSPMGSRTNQRF